MPSVTCAGLFFYSRTFVRIMAIIVCIEFVVDVSAAEKSVTQPAQSSSILQQPQNDALLLHPHNKDELDALIRFRPNTIQHRTSDDDSFMDPCKAHGFLTDIALGEDDMESLHAHPLASSLLSHVSRKPFQLPLSGNEKSSAQKKRRKQSRQCPVLGPLAVLEHCLERQYDDREREEEEEEQPEEDELMIVDPDLSDFLPDPNKLAHDLEIAADERTKPTLLLSASLPINNDLNRNFPTYQKKFKIAFTDQNNNSNATAGKQILTTVSPKSLHSLQQQLTTNNKSRNTTTKAIAPLAQFTQQQHSSLLTTTTTGPLRRLITPRGEQQDHPVTSGNSRSVERPLRLLRDDFADVHNHNNLLAQTDPDDDDDDDYDNDLPPSAQAQHFYDGKTQTATLSQHRTKRAATAKRERLWDFGVIPYVIGENTTHERRAVYVAAMRHWMNHTCITFVEHRLGDVHQNYIFFTERPCGCCSFVGKRGNGGQAISIGKNCDKFGIVVHELGHVVGYWHEHTRPDRDKHVDIIYKNVMSGQEYNFAKLNGSEVDSLGQPYDYASIMHYARNTFSKSTYLDTILPRVFLEGSASERPEIGQRLHLSPGDIAQTKALYKCLKCGRTMLEPYDFFRAPEYEHARLLKNTMDFGNNNNIILGVEGVDKQKLGAFLSDEQHCVWKIFATPGEVIALNITDLDLSDDDDNDSHGERHTNINLSSDNNGVNQKCKNTYLEIRDGYWHLSPLLARFCGDGKSTSTALLALRSTGAFVYVEYRRQRQTSPFPVSSARNLYPSFSRPSTVGRGFQAYYEFICGGNISAPHGTLQSPNFPDLYRPDKECIWIITVKPGYQVALRFDSFEIENHDQCIYDHLELRDGTTLSAPLITTRLCGYEKPDTVIKSSSNTMYVRFVSDGSVQKSGFSAEYVTEFDECVKSQSHGCEHKCVNTFGGYRCECDFGYELHSDGKHCEEACGGYIDVLNSNGTLSSPSFPNLYPANKKCIWQITAPERHRVILNFTHFDMEGNNEDCEYDYVLISSAVGNNGSSTTSTSDGSVDDGVWKSHGALCGQSLPPLITAESNVIRITFNSDASVQKTGFGLMYFSDYDECSNDNGGCQHQCTNTISSFRCSCQSGFDLHTDMRSCKEGGCTHDIRLPFGEIKSPGYPDPYPSRKDCMWTFHTKPGHRIGITFYKFEIEPHQECLYDYVELFDGNSPSASPMLGRFCGTNVPPPVTSSSNQMLMMFKSDASVQRGGFHGTHRSVCGGHFYAHSDEDENEEGSDPGEALYIYSHAAYGDTNYGNNEDCEWLVEASPDYVAEPNDEGEHLQSFVYVEFDAFEIEDDPECTYDFVDIYDGYAPTTENAQKIGRFCSNILPPTPIVASGRALLVKFKSDASINAKGFKFRYGMSASVRPGSIGYEKSGFGPHSVNSLISSRLAPHYLRRTSLTPDGWIDDKTNLKPPSYHPHGNSIRHQAHGRIIDNNDDDDEFDSGNFGVEVLPPEAELSTTKSMRPTTLTVEEQRKLDEYVMKNLFRTSTPALHLTAPPTPSPPTPTSTPTHQVDNQLLRNFRHHHRQHHHHGRTTPTEQSFNHFSHEMFTRPPPQSTTLSIRSTRQSFQRARDEILRRRYYRNNSTPSPRHWITTSSPHQRYYSSTTPTYGGGVARSTSRRGWYLGSANDVHSTTTPLPYWWQHRRHASSVVRATTAMPPIRSSAPAPTIILENVDYSSQILLHANSNSSSNNNQNYRGGSRRFPLSMVKQYAVKSRRL